jgi:hypothetical protein
VGRMLISTKLLSLEKVSVHLIAPMQSSNIKFIARVGKSSLTLKYCKNQFSDKQESTVDATY